MKGFAADPQRLVGSVIGRRYRLTRLIGQGGMGAVFEANDRSGQRWAVKTLLESADGERFARLMREAKLTRTLDSPHVVPVAERGYDQSLAVAYLVMPLLDGTDLEHVLSRTGALEPTAAVRIAVQACRGVAAAHAAGVIHRDVKPSNLFLEQQPDGQLRVRLLDFGIGRGERDSSDIGALTATGRALGTPLYMAPEQMRSSKHVDQRADVYSIGSLLYEMLAGAAPFAYIDSVGDLMVAVITQDPRPLRERAPWVDPGLAAIVDRAIARLPEARTASATELERTLQPYLGGTADISSSMLISAPRSARSDSADGCAPTMASDAALDPLLGTRLGGSYVIVRRIGEGGMGAVYEVRAPDGSALAAKVISKDVAGPNDDAVRRFLREARTSTAIDSPHVVRTFDVRTDDSLKAPFILMELLEGVDLGRLLSAGQPLSPIPVLRAFLQAARGLSAAHARGLVHRDVKPANLFLHAPGGGSVTVKLCDFGIAKHVQQGLADMSHDLTRTGGMVGSPMYMSPEQARNAKTVDHRADIWSLSASLFEALSGRKLWQGASSLADVILAICTAPVPRLEQLAPWLPAGLAAVVHRGLEREPAARWSSVDELAAALAPFAGDRQDFTLEQLQPVEGALQAQAQSLLSGTTAAVSSRVATPTPQPAGAKRSRLLVLGALLVLSASAAVWFGRRVVTKQQVDPQPAASVPIADAAATVRVAVAIVPPDATVRVNGAERAVVNGRIELEAVVGDSFDVAVRRGGASRTARVVVTRGGKAEPPEIVLETPVASASLSAAVQVANRVPVAAPHIKPSATPETAPTPKMPAPAKTATSASTARPTRDNW